MSSKTDCARSRATDAAIIAAALVPPSASKTSQSIYNVCSPKSVSTTARSTLPIKREISTERPFFDHSRFHELIAQLSHVATSNTQLSTTPVHCFSKLWHTFCKETVTNTFVLPSLIKTAAGTVVIKSYSNEKGRIARFSLLSKPRKNLQRLMPLQSAQEHSINASLLDHYFHHALRLQLSHDLQCDILLQTFLNRFWHIRQMH